MKLNRSRDVREQKSMATAGYLLVRQQDGETGHQPTKPLPGLVDG